MAQIIVKTDLRKSYKAEFPHVGNIEIDENGEFEVEHIDMARNLISYSNEFYLKSEGKPDLVVLAALIAESSKEEAGQDLSNELTPEEIAEQAEAVRLFDEDQLQKTNLDELGNKGNEDELGGSDEDQLGKASEDELSAEDKAELIAALPGMTRKDLETACGNYPGGEWRGKNKDLLVEYLTGKLS